MSVQITQHPKAISFSRNPVVFQFYTDAQYQTKGKPFVAKLSFAYENTAPFNFTLKYGDLTLNFNAVLVPDDSGYQLPTRQIDNAEAYATLMAQSLGENFYLGRDFIFTVGNDGVNYWVVATARNNGTGYSMGFTGSPYMGFQTLQAGVNDVPNANFKLYTEIWAKIGGASKPYQVSNAYLEVDTEGVVNMDISDALTGAMLATGYDRPDFLNAIAAINTASTCQYYIRYAEVYGDTQVIKRVFQTDTYYAVLGGISKEMLGTIQLPDSFIGNGKLLFLKQDAAEKYLLPLQDEFLSIIMLDADHAGVSLKFVITYTDNSTVTLLKFALGDVARYTKLTFPVGFVQNNFNLLNDTKIVLNYTVVLVDSAGTEISETRKYWVDYQLRQYVRQFLYLSSLGTYDTLITFGQGSTQYNLVQSSAEITTGKGFILANGESINYSSSLNNVETVTSGYRELTEIRLFKDLALSLDMLLFRKKRIYPVAFSSNNVKEFKDADNLHAITFDFGFRYNEELYTTDPADDDSDAPLFLPLSLAQMPDAPIQDSSYDYRYYKKTETYNQTEIDNLLATLKGDIDTLSDQETDDVEAINLALADKADLVHNHNDLYIPRTEMQDLLTELDDVLKNGVGLKADDIGYGLNFDDAKKLVVDAQVIATKQSVTDVKNALATHPTYVKPTAVLTSPQSANKYEVGQSVAVTVNLSFTQNDGGAATGYSIKKAGNPVSSGNSFTETIVMALAAVQYQGSISYNAGSVKNNIPWGDPDPVGQIQGDTANSGALSFQGYYAMRYGSVAVAVSDSAGVRGLVSSQLTVVGNTFTINSGTANRIFQFWLPNGKNLTSVIDQDALNAVVTGAFSGTALSVNDAAGNPVAGNLYTMTNAVPYSTSHRLLVTTS